ncbi:hypothetical protein B0H11DRAFT_2235966 [Mycena galericulata]|nr:hypothetical protein B0H11DRAFT_2235966 [Mycena galericulata]
MVGKVFLMGATFTGCPVTSQYHPRVRQALRRYGDVPVFTGRLSVKIQDLNMGTR